jgi:two-component system, NarL family, nitrate/nitrite response regulator NarL
VVQVLVAAPQDVTSALPADSRDVSFEPAEPGTSVVRRLETGPLPDVLLLDFDFPGLSGLKGIHTLRTHFGARPLGVFVHGAPLELARRLLAAGADGVLPATTGGEALLGAITLLATGERFVIFTPHTVSAPHRTTELLSDRELQVLQGICDGLQNKEIAHAFQVQEVTVKMHVRAIIRKLGARNRTQAAMVARDLGIV